MNRCFRGKCVTALDLSPKHAKARCANVALGLTHIPARRPLFLYHLLRTLPSTMAQSTHEARLELAIADLAKQDNSNYMATAKKHGVARTTLRKRFLGQRLSTHAAAVRLPRYQSLALRLRSAYITASKEILFEARPASCILND